MTLDSSSSFEGQSLTSPTHSLASEQPIFVLGMHRSGTSFLAGSLQAYGMHSGRVYEWSKHNLRGNRENADIMALNDAVLAESAGAWDQPPAGPLKWTDQHRAARDAIIASLHSTSSGMPIGFKDPRTLLTWDFWHEGVAEPRIASIVRHPVAVAASLQARNKWPLARGIALWSAYNQRLRDILLRTPDSHLLLFDWPRRKLCQQTLRTAHALGLARDAHTRNQGKAFFSGRLRQQSATEHNPEPTPELATAVALYEEMTDLAHSRSLSAGPLTRDRWNHFCSRIRTLRP